MPEAAMSARGASPPLRAGVTAARGLYRLVLGLVMVAAGVLVGSIVAGLIQLLAWPPASGSIVGVTALTRYLAHAVQLGAAGGATAGIAVALLWRPGRISTEGAEDG